MICKLFWRLQQVTLGVVCDRGVLQLCELFVKTCLHQIYHSSNLISFHHDAEKELLCQTTRCSKLRWSAQSGQQHRPVWWDERWVAQAPKAPTKKSQSPGAFGAYETMRVRCLASSWRLFAPRASRDVDQNITYRAIAPWFRSARWDWQPKTDYSYKLTAHQAVKRSK